MQGLLAASEVDRLVTLGKLWFNIQYFHPFLAYKDVDWDEALLRAIPRVQAAKTSEQYAAAVESMLAGLGDPMTRVVAPRQVKAVPQGKRWFRIERQEGLVVLTMLPLGAENFTLLRRQFPELESAIRQAEAVVFDLRVEQGMEAEARAAAGALSNEAGFWNLLIDRPVRQPGVRYRTHDAYQSGFEYSEAHLLRPAEGRRRHSAFIVNRHSTLPAMAGALQASGQAVVIFSGSGEAVAPGSAKAILLEDGWRAEYRADELILKNGSGQPEPSLRVSDDKALEVATEQARKPASFPAPATPLPLLPNPRSTAYPGTDYPPRELRLLAAFRIWGILHYFFAYKHLMEEDWEQVLRRFIPRLLDARDERDYHLAVAEMVAQTGDSHCTVSSPVLSEYFGPAPAAVQLRMIEGRPVVVRLAGPAPGVREGDIVRAVEGEEAGARFVRLARYIAASTPQALREAVMKIFLNGSEGSTATLMIEDRDGRLRQVRIPRSRSFQPGLVKRRDGDVVQVLRGDTGYVDLDRLEPSDVDRMFEKLRDTKAIMFDLRGYPNETAWSIAPRLAEKLNVVAAVFRRRIWFEPDGFGLGEIDGHMIYHFEQRLPETGQWRYRGKIVTLIDERSISQAEHSCLFFEAAAATVFVGSPTAGADGEVASFTIPGNIRVTYSGHDVRHADGSQLQRKGIQPHVLVESTINGIRAGRDEVLERALDYLEAGQRSGF
jgi:C-terminal processing protease CtpA/Prc